MREIRSKNRTAMSDEQFYTQNAESFGRASVIYLQSGYGDIAADYARRAAGYLLDLEEIQNVKKKDVVND